MPQHAHLIGAGSLPAALLWVQVCLGAVPPTLEDAALLAVHLIDEHEGWAVGEQGMIWHTMDGGALWERQISGTRATLTSVHMQDFRVGWVGGRQSLPYNPGSMGVILRTEDGGGRWRSPGSRQLSGVRHVFFPDEISGWALAESTDQHPSGLFVTTSRGVEWNVLKGRRWPGWRAAYFFGFDEAVFGGHDGSLVRFLRGQLGVTQSDWQAGTAVRDLAASGEWLWAVGDRGQILVSQDRGRQWKRPELPIDPETAAVWDFHAVSAVDTHVWAIGRPGSVVLHSADAGKSWEAQRTGQPLPMNDLQFVDTAHGWAVGALGTILATKDGGQTWQVQRQGGGRAAILWLGQDHANVPLSVIARYGGEDGFHIVALAITCPDFQTDIPGIAARPARFAEAFRAVGGSLAETTWRFPLARSRAKDPAESNLAAWNKLHGGNCLNAIERELVLAIRLWRPEVVITDWLEPGARVCETSALIAHGVQQAFKTAADPLYFTDQMEFFGLQPHAADRLFARHDAAEKASVVCDAHQTSLRLGQSYADAADEAMMLAHSEYVPTESLVKLVLLEAKDGKTGKSDRLHSPTAGLSIAPGLDARRETSSVGHLSEESLDIIKQRSTKKRNVLAIASRPAGTFSPEQLLAHLDELTAELDMLQAGQVLFGLGRCYVESGRWDFAHSTFHYLIKHHPQHPLTLEAQRWIIAYLTSGEARRRFRVLGGPSQTPLEANEAEDSKLPSTTGLPPVPTTNDRDQRAAKLALMHAARLKTASPQLWADPRVQLCLATAYRKLRDIDYLPQIEACYRQIVAVNPKSRWSSVSELERHSVPAAVQRVAWCVATKERPYLDGASEESVWRTASVVQLHSGDARVDAQFATQVRMLHDGEFLYLAVRCNYPDASHWAERVQRTGHDADVERYDRVELLLDVDRDYNTYYRLRIDQRGLVAEDCWGDVTWNPRLFVAVDSDKRGWRLEAAIPLTELVLSEKARSLTGETWAFNVIRIVPGMPPLSFCQPAAVDVRPEGFTHLKLVEQVPKSPSSQPLAN